MECESWLIWMHTKTTILGALPYCICLFWVLTKGYLTEALKDKMKYLRNVKPRPVKQVRSGLKEESGMEDRSDSEEEVQARKPRKQFRQFPRVPAAPLIPPGEDNAVYLRHIRMLQHEERKVSPGKRVISDLTRRTYPFRRQEILERPQLIRNLLQTYPSLKRSEQVQQNYAVYKVLFCCQTLVLSFK